MRYLFYSGESPTFGGYTVLWQDGGIPIGDIRPEILSLRLYDWQGGNDGVLTPEKQWLSWRIVDHHGNRVGQGDAEDLSGRCGQWLRALDRRLEERDPELTAAAENTCRFFLVGELEVDVNPECQSLLERAGNHLDYVMGCQNADGQPLPEARQGADGLFSFYEREDGILKPKATRKDISA